MWERKGKNGTFFLYFSYPLFFSPFYLPTFSPSAKVPLCLALPLDISRVNNCLINLPVIWELELERCPVRPACPRVIPSHCLRAVTNAPTSQAPPCKGCSFHPGPKEASLVLSRFSQCCLTLLHRASEGIHDSFCSRELRTFAWHFTACQSIWVILLGGAGDCRGFPVAGILSTHFGSTSLPRGAKELLTSRQVTLCAGMRWEVMLDWDVFLFPTFLPTIFLCCTITAESNPGLFIPPNPNVYPNSFFRLHNTWKVTQPCQHLLFHPSAATKERKWGISLVSWSICNG